MRVFLMSRHIFNSQIGYNFPILHELKHITIWSYFKTSRWIVPKLWALRGIPARDTSQICHQWILKFFKDELKKVFGYWLRRWLQVSINYDRYQGPNWPKSNGLWIKHIFRSSTLGLSSASFQRALWLQHYSSLPLYNILPGL